MKLLGIIIIFFTSLQALSINNKAVQCLKQNAESLDYVIETGHLKSNPPLPSFMASFNNQSCQYEFVFKSCDDFWLVSEVFSNFDKTCDERMALETERIIYSCLEKDCL